MNKLIVSEYATLDGVMEAPGGEPGHPHTGWTGDFHDSEQMGYKLTEALEAESLLVGRVTYESLAEAWPTYQGAFADKMNGHAQARCLDDPARSGVDQLGGDR